MVALQVGGFDDHVHIVLGIRPTANISQAVQLLKGGSSKWIRETFPNMADFAWQNGYGAFTVSQSSNGRADPVCGEATRAPARSNISGGVPRVFEKARNRI